MSKYESDFPPLYIDEQRELEKTFYIKDKKKRVQRLREIQDMPVQQVALNNSIVCSVEDSPSQEIGFRYGNILHSTKRALQVDILLEEIFSQASLLKNKQDKINFLIDERYKYRIDVFDTDKENEVFKSEYNEFIADKIREKLRELDKEATEQKENSVVFKPLKWNAKKNVLGTFFGVLIDKGLIEGQKATIAKMLGNYFENLSQDSIIDNVKFKKHNKIGRMPIIKTLRSLPKSLLKSLNSNN